MSSQLNEKLASIIQEIVVSYEARISTIGTLIDNTYGIMQESKAALGRVNSQLRETLANSASLRKKDYNKMVAEIESQQEERHRQVKNLLNEFILLHKETASQLKTLLADARTGKTVDFRTALTDIQARQDESQKKVMSQLESDRQEQEEFLAEMQRILNNSGTVKARDLKATIRKFSVNHKEQVLNKVMME